MRAQERKGKEKREKRPPQSSGNTRQDKERRACRSLPCSALPHRGRQKGKEDGRTKGGPFVPAFLLLFHSFLFHCCQKRRSKEKRRREEGFGEGGGTLSFPCLSLPIVPPSFIFILSFSLFLSPSPCPSLSFLPLMRFLSDKETGKKDWERNAPPATPRRRHFLRIRVQKLKSRKQREEKVDIGP